MHIILPDNTLARQFFYINKDYFHNPNSLIYKENCFDK